MLVKNRTFDELTIQIGGFLLIVHEILIILREFPSRVMVNTKL